MQNPYQHAQETVPQTPEAPPAVAAVDVLTTTADERRMAMLIHLLTLVGYFIPFGTVVLPLIIWLPRRHESAFIDHHGKEAINFQINLLIFMLVSAVVAFAAAFLGIILGSLTTVSVLALVGFGLVVLIVLINVVLIVYDWVVTIIAAISASTGSWYAYGFGYRFIK